MQDKLIIAVDCGETVCRARIERDGARFDLTGPGGNATTDPLSCAGVITRTLSDLAASIGTDMGALATAPAYLSVVGVSDPARALALAQLLPLEAPVIEHDQRAATRGALGATHGLVAVIGTGSFLARQETDGPRYLGGYGLVLGDEASGSWLGREACALTLRAADGMAPDSPVLVRLRHELGGHAGVIAFAARADPAGFAALAPMLVAEAEEADVGASLLMLRGAAYIAQAVDTLGRGPQEPLCLLGELGPAYARWLEPRLRQALAVPAGNTLDGALQLAREVADGWRP